MAQIIWSPNATRQIEEIAEYIEKDSPYYAGRVVLKIYATVSRLKSFPEMGNVASEFREQNVREQLVFQYRVFYRFVEGMQCVRVLAIVHGRRQIDNAFIDES